VKVLPVSLLTALRAVARREVVTLFITLLAALVAVLRTWTSQEDLVVGTVVAQRDRAVLEDLIGCFINFLPLRVRRAGGASWRDLLAALRTTVLDAFAHQECPFEKIVEAVNPDRRQAGTNPLYNVALLLQSFPRQWRFAPGLEATFFAQETGTALLDLRLIAEETESGLRLELEYRSDLFSAETAQHLLASYQGALDRLARSPDEPVAAYELTAELAAQAGAQRRSPVRRIAIASTFTAQSIEKPLRFWMEKLGLAADLAVAPYGQVFEQLLDPSSLLLRGGPGCNVILMRFEDWWRNLPAERGAGLERNARELATALRSAGAYVDTPFLVCLCPASPSLLADAATAGLFAQLEESLTAELAASGILTVTSAELAATYPVADPHDAYTERLGHIPYTPAFFTALATMVARRIYRLNSPPHKVIVLDCDGTLWRGSCAEEGPLGVAVDPPYQALQQLMVQQHDAGMLLCLCSKNRPEDVHAVFDRHPAMRMARHHVIAERIDWRPKPESLRSLSEELGLGLHSFVFVDDNPVECAAVRASCPEVWTCQLPAAAEEIPRLLRHVWAFDHLHVTVEDRRRTDLYRQRAERERLRQQAPSLGEFLAGLGLEVLIAELEPGQLQRAAQLTQRTNQLNFTTIRRSVPELERALGSGELQGRGVEVRDRFGEYGLVGLLLFRCGGGTLWVDTFLLSCRVLGRGVEHRMLAALGDLAWQQGLERVAIPFVPSERNCPAAGFLADIARGGEEPWEAGSLFVLSAAQAAAVRLSAGAAGAESVDGAATALLPVGERASGPVRSSADV
jgi:FkbH-like protein